MKLNPEYEQAEASLHFDKAKTKATLSRIHNFLHADRDNLLSLSEVKKIVKPRNEVYRGLQAVPINKIVGSEGRYRDFNKFFFPRSEYLRARWQKIDIARIRDTPLPVIKLYEIGGAYFVRDGNHRVSVARSRGGEIIDAEITSLSSEITILPSMTVEDLQRAVIEFEKKGFYEKTHFDELTGDTELNFTQPGRYDEINNHILEHKYYLNQKQRDEIPFEKALVSWYNNVYSPIIKIIDEDLLCVNFPGRSPSDLYVWIIKYWDDLKKEHGIDYPVSDAAQDFSEKYGDTKGRGLRLLIAKIARLLKKKRHE